MSESKDSSLRVPSAGDGGKEGRALRHSVRGACCLWMSLGTCMCWPLGEDCMMKIEGDVHGYQVQIYGRVKQDQDKVHD